MNDAPEWLANILIVAGFIIATWAITAVLVRIWRWALLKIEAKRSEYERWSGE